MMDAGVGASVACYRDTFAKGLNNGLTHTITNYDQNKANFDFAQSTVRISKYIGIYILLFKRICSIISPM